MKLVFLNLTKYQKNEIINSMKTRILNLIQNKWIILLFCLIFNLSLFSNTFQNDFVFDDLVVIRDNQILKNIKNLPQLFTSYYYSSSAGLYRPLTMTSYALNYFLFGSGVWSFHLINILLHALNCWLLFLLIYRLVNRKNLAYLTSFLFLILPIHTEAVTGLVGRAELLAFFFSFLTLLLLTVDQTKKWYLPLAILCFLSALLSKETALAVLPIYFFITFYQKQLNKNTLKNLIGLGLTLIIYLVVRALILGPYFLTNNATIVENPLKFVPASARIFTALKILALYLEKIIFPLHLSSDYSFNQIPAVTNLTNWSTLIGLVILITLIYFLCQLRKTPLPIYLGSAIFFWSFLPISNLITPIGTIMAERLMYFPSAGICLIMAMFFQKLFQKKIWQWFGLAIFITLTIFYVIRTWQRNYDWRDEKTLYFSAVKVSPNSVLSRSNAGAMYILSGDYQQAEKEIIIANQIFPYYPHAVNNLGLIYHQKGEYEKAERQFLQTLEISPDYIPAKENLALNYLIWGKYTEAKNWLLILFNNDEKKVKNYIQDYFEIKIRQALTKGDQKLAEQWIKIAREILLE